MKQVKLTVTTPSGTVEVGRADIEKNPDGTVSTELTITNLRMQVLLGGNKIKGTIENYELNDLEEPDGQPDS
jgi:hypothetical protein